VAGRDGGREGLREGGREGGTEGAREGGRAGQRVGGGERPQHAIDASTIFGARLELIHVCLVLRFGIQGLGFRPYRSCASVWGLRFRLEFGV
jgi:hypothetical protein